MYLIKTSAELNFKYLENAIKVIKGIEITIMKTTSKAKNRAAKNMFIIRIDIQFCYFNKETASLQKA